MKKRYLMGIILVIAVLFLAARLIWFEGTDISNAQTSDIEYQKLLERDKNVPQEKVDRAFAEAKKIQDDIVAAIAKKKPEFKLHHRLSNYSINHPPGRRGETLDELGWRTEKTWVSMNVHLGLRREDELILFREGLEHISMGDFFKVPNLGDEAVLVKNVLFNTRMTNVGLHFVKGRAMVDVYLTNHKRSREKNEKELIEIVRLIEPLIVARPNFDDL